MSCALCLQNKPLCKSHIIPEFFYKPLYDDTHRMWALSATPGTPIKRPRKGIYEKLLCKDCEQLFGAWESYGCQVLKIDRWQASPFGRLFSGIEYKRFKLFEMSLLWRAAVSKHPDFRQLQLPRKRKEQLRKMLLSANPGDALDFACALLASHQLFDLMSDLVLMPQSDVHNEIGTCMFLMGGIAWMFFIPRAGPVAETNKFVLTENGDVTVVMNDSVFRELFQNFVKAVDKSGNLSFPRKF